MVTGRRKSVIANFENYEINEKGEIHLLNYFYPEHNCFGTLSKRVDRGGYHTVRLHRNGRAYTKYLHRLLGLCFLKNPENKLYINHLDGNKLNNELSNLVWCTASENTRHAHENHLIKVKTKPVRDLCTGKEFTSAKAAAHHYGLNYGTLRNYLNGNIKNNPTCLEYISAAES